MAETLTGGGGTIVIDRPRAGFDDGDSFEEFRRFQESQGLTSDTLQRHKTGKQLLRFTYPPKESEGISSPGLPRVVRLADYHPPVASLLSSAQ